MIPLAISLDIKLDALNWTVVLKIQIKIKTLGYIIIINKIK